MKTYVLDNRKVILPIIAIYQILGSLVMFYVLYTAVGPGRGLGAVFAIIPVFIVNLISLFAGVVYFTNGESLRFFLLSKLNFGLQMVQISVSGFKFLYFYGPFLAIGMNGAFDFLFNFELVTASFSFGISSQIVNQFVTINLVPILPLVMLRWAERNPPQKKELENAFLEEEPVQ